MNRILFVMIGVSLLVSCSTTKSTSKKITPVGEWDYSITDTPSGDFSGVMVVKEENKVYSAFLNSEAGNVPFENFTWEMATKKLGGDFYYDGNPIKFEATLTEPEMVGAMSAGTMSFPFKATRKK